MTLQSGADDKEIDVNKAGERVKVADSCKDDLLSVRGLILGEAGERLSY